MITLNCIHQASHLMSTLPFNTCQFLHWNYVPWTQYLGPLLSIFDLFFKLYLYLSACDRGLTLTSCIGDTRLLTILAYIKDYTPKLLVIIIIIIIIIIKMMMMMVVVIMLLLLMMMMMMMITMATMMMMIIIIIMMIMMIMMIHYFHWGCNLYM